MEGECSRMVDLDGLFLKAEPLENLGEAATKLTEAERDWLATEVELIRARVASFAGIRSMPSGKYEEV